MPIVRALLDAMGTDIKPVMLTTTRGNMHFGHIEQSDNRIVSVRKEDGKLVYICREYIESGFIVER